MEDSDTDSDGVSGWRFRAIIRMQRAMAYWGVLDHPYGREYARQKFTPFGGRRKS